ncbi:MAG: helix-turn-helix domain-containing protein [Spirochaetales bacterium]|nr:helix-turn-helix domain-containing protein [Spirochaetales bacterium]
MELFGEKLREIRESKKYTIDQVARETRISKQYLEALENEDFQVFPGETYLIGFLRSYAEYLDLDPDHYVNLYKNIKIQEQPIPFNELLDMKKKLSPFLIGLAAFLGVALVAAIGVILFFTLFNKTVDTGIANTTDLPVKKEDGEIFRFHDEVMTEWFRKGDLILVELGEKEYPVEVMATGREADLKVMEKPVLLSMGIEQSFDLNEDGKLDLSLVCNDFKESEYGNEVNLGFYKINVLKLVYTEDELAAKETDETIDADTTKETGVPESGETPSPKPEITPREEPAPSPENTRRKEETPSPKPEITQGREETTTSTEGMTGAGDSSLLVNNVKIKQDTRNVIVEAAKPESFTISIEFRGYCNFSYQIDEKPREYRFFLKDDSVSLSAAREVMLWISNANSAKTTIAGQSVVMGKAGQVVTKLVYWIKDETDGKYRLEIASVY